MVSLQEVLNMCKIPVCNILKIDCEGCELDVFPEIANGLHTIIPTITGEVHNYNFLTSEEQKKVNLCRHYKKQHTQGYEYEFTHLKE